MRNKIFSRATMGVCGAIGALAECKVPDIVLQPMIKAYSMGFQVNLTEASVPREGFANFGDFFARSLVDGSRPICPEPGAVTSPCDGKIAAIQNISENDSDIFRVKGFDYSIDQLLGAPCEGMFANGQGMVIYLHPRDYHRVHAPLDAELFQVRHIAGARFPVAPWAEERVSGIYQRNERMVFQFKIGESYLSLAMVAAFGVGHIATPYAPPKGDHTSSVRLFESPVSVKRGDEIGAFRLGSTVVMLWTKQFLQLSPTIELGKVLLGEKMGTMA